MQILKRGECPPTCARTFEAVRPNLQCRNGRPALAAAWAAGRGAWNTMFPFLNDADGVRLIARSRGGILTPAMPVAEIEETMKLHIAFLLSQWARAHVSYTGFDKAFCAIIRVNSAILLFGKFPGIYLPAPAMSGHEAIEDLGRLEKDFPGKFRIEEERPFGI